MAKRHAFNFEGGEMLTTIGATWFVSYHYHKRIDPKHDNWNRVGTANNRKSTYNRSSEYHRFWLEQVISMDNAKLATNKIGLDSEKIKEMTRELLALNK